MAARSLGGKVHNMQGSFQEAMPSKGRCVAERSILFKLGKIEIGDESGHKPKFVVSEWRSLVSHQWAEDPSQREKPLCLLAQAQSL